MSAGPDPQVDVNQLEQARRQINRLAEEVAQLSEMELSPPEYYGEFLQRVMTAIQAPGGAVWVRTPQGNLQLQYQVNMRQVFQDQGDNARAMHGELLRQIALKGQPGLILPHSSVGEPEGNAPPPGNPTPYVTLLAPILYEKQVAGIVEIWQDPNRPMESQRGFLQFIIRMAALAAGYTRNHQLRQMVGQQQVWVQLEAFARQIHGSLNPTEVAYLVANEGRRLVEADRVSVAVREGRKAQVRAISGADVVEKRSNLVQLMRALFQQVIEWGEKLVHTGTKDEGLPPGVAQALDAYLAESNSKLLIVVPLQDERDKDTKQKPRSAIMMEAFETTTSSEQMAARLEVVARHATSALYNAAEYRRIPMRFLWLPLAKLQDGLGGKAKAILSLILFGLGVLIAAMIFVPYPLKMDATGQLLPIQRSWLYAPVEGHVREIPVNLKSGSKVVKGQTLLILFDLNLANQINDLVREIRLAEATMKIPQGPDTAPDIKVKALEAAQNFNLLSERLRSLKERTNSLETPGEFAVKSPMTGIILSSDFRETLLNRFVKPNEPLIRIGATDTEVSRVKLADWEVELKIPQKHIGQVLEAYRDKTDDELEVDLLALSKPTETYKARLKLSKIAKQANANPNQNNEPEPVVLAWVRIAGKDIPANARLPQDVLLTGTEVHARIRCGNRAMGYSLFYGVWEFIYEKIVFFF